MDAHTIEILIATFGGTITILVGALVWALKYSMSSNKEIAGKFDTTINNHLADSDKVLIQVCNSNDRNTEAIKALIDGLRRR